MFQLMNTFPPKKRMEMDGKHPKVKTSKSFSVLVQCFSEGRQGRSICVQFSGPFPTARILGKQKKGQRHVRGRAQSQHSIGGIETAFPCDECLLNIEKWNLESVGLEKDFRGIYQYILQRYSFRLRQGLTVSGLTCCQALVELDLPNLIHQF